MNDSPKVAEPSLQDELLKDRLQQIIANQALDVQQFRLASIAAELGVDVLTCAAALLCLATPPPIAEANMQPQISTQSAIKMVRYRLDVGSQHSVTVESIKKVLVEESGVDKNNIANINIRGLYTLIELPDAMPQDIYLHLKTVEINQRKLDIKRVKPRSKKRHFIRRGKPPSQQAETEYPKPMTGY